MKYVVPLIVMIIILIIFVDITSYKYLYTSSNSMEKKLDVIEKNIKNDNWKSAETCVNDLEKTWGKVNSKWAILIEHREIDDIDMSLSKLKSFIDSKNKDLSLAELKTLKELYSHIPSNEKLTLENIL
ncbi:DUF4363 family protein [Thermoanaerobacterium thermosaccharolyticum]|jgi:uncharacterized protein YabN with tetrapyrrole methylase and pyrophosphatase domain|uniref:DUF4363 family protein n=1 Tax=Thermoanaerobacterium thermosaccharolyticum TaxID=1517 RepID=A0A231VGC6_THETR|nr:DUF4363 family protein [Thermoanaerobacterium thermosaccharolyticum]TCW42233.1 uncharacterized protein DUF4363 [Thermohydrogenium kirishiense]AST56885.1 hypothetical protein Thert_00725 [Thermoanaerobacterium thermosaccharolyticum]MBE0068174.1 DUF4363 family protein [Thermoanaerobacterium thermosaccharolyticum]MBE0227949.1 DUF4363 family protein [Thermoanaerobacterium thermosaccharolyticum]MCP2239228.1 uncharacterized protein YabN with tetrapyrrole methylase and pyrophosphatase domain [Ther